MTGSVAARQREAHLALAFGLAFLAALSSSGCGGGSGPSGGGTPPPPPPPTPSTTQVVSLAAKQIVYDSSRKLLYASVASVDATHPNTVAIIDPPSASVTATIPVGTDPHRLALSQDGIYLYVGTDGINSVQRINLMSKTVEATISLGGNSLVAGDIAVMPGASKTVAIVRRDPFSSPSTLDVAVYDDTTMRSNTTASSGQTIDVIAFSDSGTSLYGLDNEISDFAFVRMNVGANGLTVQDATWALLGWGYYAKMVYNSGLVYSTFGSVADPSSLALKGKFPANPSNLPNQTTTPFAESVFVDQGVPYLLTHDRLNGNGPIISAYDPQHYVMTAASTVPSGSQEEDSLVTCGMTCFAFVAYPQSGNSIVVISTAALTPVPTTPPTLANLMPNHILWDPGSARLYASIPAAAGTWGNSVAVINPATKAVESTIFAGSEPNALAVSGDSQFLYVGLDGAGSIARINLASHALEAQYFLGNRALEGPLRAQQIAVMPGAPHTYVAILRFKSNPSPNDAGTAVYDDGVQRPNTTTSNDMMAFSDTPSVLYGYGYQLSGNVQIMAIDTSGISVTNTVTRPVLGLPTRLQFYSGTLYSSTGRAIIPATPALAGTFNVASPRDIAVDGAGGSAYFLADDATTQKATLLQYDLKKFVLNAYQDLSSSAGTGTEIAECGSSGFAVLISPGVELVNGTFTALPPLSSNAANLAANRLIWNSSTGQIIASVPGFVGPGGNSIAVIDPNSKTVTSSFYVGSEPDPMSLASDGNTLFVGLDGSGTVAQVNLQSQSVTYATSLGFDPLAGPLIAQNLSANPVSSNEVAVSRLAGVVILNQGAELSNIAASPFDSINSIAFGSSGTNLYGYNNANTGFDFYRMSVSPSGVSLVDKYERLFYGFYADIQNHGGFIFSSNGTVVDPAVPALRGMFPGANASVSAFFDDTTKEAYFLQYDPTKTPSNSVLRYNLSNYSFLDSTPVNGPQSQGWDLIRYGTNNIALATSSGLTFATVSTAIPPVPDLAHLTVKHLLNDPMRNRIYATVPGSVPAIGNSIGIIDPTAAAIVSSIPVGSEPDVMALSADGAYLYVGLDGAGSIARVNLATGAVDQTFSLGTDTLYGADLPGSIAVSPTNSTIIAVARAFSNLVPDQAGVAIFSNGTMLPSTTQTATGSGTVAFCSSGSTLYGFDNQTTGFGFYTMSVTSSGVQQTGVAPNLIMGAANIICDMNVIYASSGYAVDPVNNKQLGVFSGLMNPGGMAVDDANQKVFFLDTDPNTKAVSIVGFNQTNYSRTGTLSVTAASSPGRDLIRWGPNGLAVATQNQVLLLTGTLP